METKQNGKTVEKNSGEEQMDWRNIVIIDPGVANKHHWDYWAVTLWTLTQRNSMCRKFNITEEFLTWSNSRKGCAFQ